MSILRSMSGDFIVKQGGELQSYTNYSDVPSKTDHVIKFVPDIPTNPHTIEDHQEMAEWEGKLKKALENSGTPPATRIGDADIPHCSGMVRAEGSPNVFINDIPWSRQTDLNTPHLLPPAPCPTHAAPIVLGSPTVFVNGLGAGRVGDATCTAVAEGSPNVFCGP